MYGGQYYDPLSMEANQILKDLSDTLSKTYNSEHDLMKSMLYTVDSIEQYYKSVYFGTPKDFDILIQNVVDRLDRCYQIPALLKVVLFSKLFQFARRLRMTICDRVIINLQMINFIDIEKLLDLVKEYYDDINNMCTTITNGSYKMDYQIICKIVRIQYYFQFKIGIQSRVSWYSVWNNYSYLAPNLLNDVTVAPTQSSDIPQLQFQVVMKYLISKKFKFEFIQDIICRYRKANDFKTILSHPRFGNIYLHDLVLDSLTNKNVLNPLKYLLDVILEELYDEISSKKEILDPIFERVVRIGMTMDALYEVINTFKQHHIYENIIIKYIKKLDFEDQKVMSQLQALDCLEYDQVSTIYLEKDNPKIIPSLKRRCDKSRNYELLFNYIWKCANGQSVKQSKYFTKSTHPYIFFIYLLKKYDCHNISVIGSEQLISYYIKDKNMQVFYEKYLSTNMVKFIETFYPVLNRSEDILLENSIYYYAFRIIFENIVKPNIHKEFMIDWFGKGLSKACHPSHLILANLIFKLYFTDELVGTKPCVYNMDLVLNNEVVLTSLKRQYEKFHLKIVNKHYSYDEWKAILSDLDVFYQLQMICNIDFDEKEIIIVSTEYEDNFKKLDNYTSIFKSLVHHFNVKIVEELEKMEGNNSRRNAIPLSKLLQIVEDNEKVLNPILKLKVKDLQVLLSSRLLQLFMNNNEQITMKRAPNLIENAIVQVKELLNSDYTTLADLKISKLINIDSFSKDLSREMEFLKQIGYEHANVFENACRLHHSIQLLHHLRDIEIPPDEKLDSLLKLDSSNISYKNSEEIMNLIIELTGIDESFKSNIVFTWNIFSFVVKCKDLLKLCQDPKYSPDEGRKQIILQSLNEFQASIFHNYWESLTYLTPFIQLISNRIDVKQFFQAISQIDIKNEESIKLYDCLNICNDEKKIEEIREIFEKSYIMEESIDSTTNRLLISGNFRVNIDSKKFSITYTDEKEREKTMGETEFRALIYNSLLKSDSVEILKKFSEISALVIRLYDFFIRMNEIGHLAFQDTLVDIPLNCKKNILSNFISKFHIIEKEWEEQVSSFHNNCKDLVPFSSRQLVFLSYVISKHDFSNLQFKQLINSVFGNVEVPNNDVDVFVPKLELNFEGFETTRQNIKEYTNSIFENVKKYISKIEQSKQNKPLEKLISNINCNDLLHDISPLDNATQLHYLISLSTHSNDILICSEYTTETDIKNKILLHKNMISGRVVLHGIEKLSSYCRSILVKYLLATRNTEAKQIICTIRDANIKNMLPPLNIHQVSIFKFVDISQILKFKNIFYYDQLVGSGKSFSIESQLYNYIRIDIHVQTTIDSIILQLEEHIHKPVENGGSIWFNISPDVSIEFVNNFMFEIICLGCVKSTNKVLFIPAYCKENWELFIEIPHVIRNQTEIVNMTKELSTIETFGKRGRLSNYILSPQYSEVIVYIQNLFEGRANTPPLEYLTNTLLPQYCKNIPTDFDGNYSHRTLTLFLSFIHQKYFMLVNNPHYTEYYPELGDRFSLPFVKLFLMEADNYLKPIQTDVDAPKGVFSVPANGGINLIPFDGKDNIPDIISRGFNELLQLISVESKKNFGDDRFIDPKLLDIDYKLIEYLASSLEVSDSFVTSVIEKYQYILIPEYLHKMIQINIRNRMKIPIILEGDSGTGKTKLVHVYSEIMTANHCNSRDSIWELIKKKENGEYIYGFTPESLHKVESVLNGDDYKKIFRIINEMIETLDDNLIGVVLQKLVKFSKDLLNPILDNIERSHGIDESLRDSMEIINNLNSSKEHLENLEKAVHFCCRTGRSYLSTVIVKKYESFVRKLLDNELAHLYDVFIKKLEENIQDQAVIGFIQQIITNEQVKNRLRHDIRSHMIEFLNEHPMVKIDEEFENQLKDPDQVINSEFLIKFFNLQRYSPFLSVLMNAQMSSQDLYEQMQDFIKLAERTEAVHKCEKCGGCAKLVCLIDESNTTSIMGKLSTLLIDHRLEEYSTKKKLPSNLAFICAVNPHGEDKKFLVSAETLSMKSFKFWWDQLNKNQLEKYIQHKISNSRVLYDLNLQQTTIDIITKLLMNCHFEVAKIITKRNMRSTVSQRDIQRLFQIFEFFYTRNFKIPGIELKNTILYSFLIAIAFCYYFRLEEFDKFEFSRNIDDWVKQIFGVDIGFNKILQTTMDYFVDDFELPPSIFKNSSLTQNLFTLLICIENRIPLILIGEPGSSKTLSLFIIRWNMGRIGRILKKFTLIDTVHRYQGSRDSTSEQVGIVCEKTKQNQAFFDSKQLKKLALFHFDEAGVTDLEKESLKILHYYLNDYLFPAVLITNDPLDVAKSNRCIESLLSKPNQQDLSQLVEGIIKRGPTDEITRETFTILQYCCSAYYKISKKSQIKGLINGWIGLRDLFHTIRFMRRNQESGSLLTISPNMLLSAIERNMNGLEQEIFREHIVKEFFDELSVYPKFKMIPNYRLNIDILKDSLSDNNRGFNKDNLNDTCVRFKLIVDETMNDSLPSILKQVGVLNNVEELYLSEFSKDETSDIHKITILSKLVAAMETGKTVALINTRALDSSCYDLFNQYYQVTKSYTDRDEYIYFTSIAIGAVSQYRKVHPNFQCVVFVRKSQVHSLESALLNRFEKFTISIKDILLYKRKFLSNSLNEQVNYLIDRAKSFANHISDNYPTNSLFTCDINATIESIVLNMITETGKIQCPLSVNDTDHKTSISNNLTYIITKLLQITRVESMLLKMKTIPQKYKDLYLKDQCHFSLEEFIRKQSNIISETSSLKWMVYTPISKKHTNLDNCYVVNLDEVDTQTTFINHLQQFNADERTKVLVVQVSETLISSHLAHQVRSTIDQNIVNGKMYLMVNSFRQDKFSLGVPALFVSSWDHHYIDVNSDNNLIDYIQSINENVVEKKLSNWDNLSKLIPQALKSIKSDNTYTKGSVFDSNQTFEARSALIIDMLERIPFLKRIILEISNQAYEISFKERDLASICQSILRNEIHNNLSEHVKNISEKAHSALMERVVFLLMDKYSILPLLDLSKQEHKNDALEKYLNFFIGAEEIGSIHECILRKGNNYLTSAPIYIPSLPFSSGLISTLSDSILNYRTKQAKKQKQEDDNGNLPLHFTPKTQELFKHIETHPELFDLLVKDLIQFYYTNHSISSQFLTDVVRSLLEFLVDEESNEEESLTIVSVISQLEHQKNDLLIENILCSIQPLIDMKLISSNNNTLTNELKLMTNKAQTTTVISKFILKTCIDHVKSLLDKKLEWSEFRNWCVCVAIATRHQEKSSQSSLAYLNILRIIIDCFIESEHIDIKDSLYDQLKRLADGKYEVNGIVQVLESVLLVIDNEEHRNNMFKSVILELIPLTQTKNSYLEFILQIVNSTHELNKYGYIPKETSIHILKSLSQNVKEEEIMICISKIINFDEKQPFDYQPSFFNERENNLMNNSKICDFIFSKEYENLDNVKDLNGIIERLNEERIDIKSVILFTCFKCKVIELSAPLIDRLERNQIRTLSTIFKSNKNYQLLFMRYLYDRDSSQGFTTLVNTKNDLFKELGLEEITSKIKQLDINTSYFPFIYEKEDEHYDMYINFKAKILSGNLQEITQFIANTIQDNQNNVYYLRMFLICIGYLELFKKNVRVNVLFHELQLQLDENEMKLVEYLFSSPENNNSSIQRVLQSRGMEADNLMNCVAFAFGIPKNTYFYNLLFNIDTMHKCRMAGELNNFLMLGTGSHRGYMDCGTKLDHQGIPGTASKIGLLNLYLLYFITFGLMSLQLEFREQSFDFFWNNVFSAAVDTEGAGSHQENIKSFTITRSTTNWLHFTSHSDLSLDQSQMLLVRSLKHLQKEILINHSPILSLPKLLDEVREFEIILSNIFDQYNKKDSLNFERLNDEHDQCIKSIEDIKIPKTKLNYSIEFFKDATNSERYPLLKLYLQNQSRMKLSKLLCLLNELYVWIHVNFNGLLTVNDLNEHLNKIIHRYYSKPKVQSLTNVLKETISLWNEYIRDFGGFQYECELEGIVEEIDENITTSYILSFNQQDIKELKNSGISVNENNRIFEAMKQLATIHNKIFYQEYISYMSTVGFKLENSRHLYTLSANNADQYMFQSIKDDSLINSLCDNGKFDWNSIQKSISYNSMLYKPKIELPSGQIYFKFRSETSINNEYKYDEFIKNIPQEYQLKIDEDILVKIHHQHHDATRDQLESIIETLMEIIENKDNYKIDCKLGEMVKGDKLMDEIKLNQIGTLLNVFVTNLRNMYYNYRSIPFEYKKELTSDQIEKLKCKISSLKLSNSDILSLLLNFKQIMLSLENCLDDVTIPIYSYHVLNILYDDVNETDPLQIIFGDIKADNYTSLLIFIQKEVNLLQSISEEKVENLIWQQDDNDQLQFVDVPTVEVPWFSKKDVEIDDFDTDEDEDNEIENFSIQEQEEKLKRSREDLRKEEMESKTLQENIISNNILLSRLVSLLEERDSLVNENNQLEHLTNDLRYQISQAYTLMMNHK